MRTIEEIKADIKNRRVRHFSESGWDISALKTELFETITNGIPLDRLEEICAAEKEGRCVVLPCKENAVIYRLVDEFECGSDCYGDTCYDCTAPCKKTETKVREGRFSVIYDSKEFGKTVFLTREEAEAALDHIGEVTEKVDGKEQEK